MSGALDPGAAGPRRREPVLWGAELAGRSAARDGVPLIGCEHTAAEPRQAWLRGWLAVALTREAQKIAGSTVFHVDHSRKQRPWETIETEALEQMAARPDVTAAVMAALLCRPILATYQRRCRLGLARTPAALSGARGGTVAAARRAAARQAQLG